MEKLECWAIVELMGHVKMAGKVSEEERFGTKMGRIEIPGPDGSFVTQWFSGGSVYRMTPTTEEIARSVASHHAPAPVHRWELPAPAKEVEAAEDDDGDDELDPVRQELPF